MIHRRVAIPLVAALTIAASLGGAAADAAAKATRSDRDGDGMKDAWERKHGLNPRSSRDRKRDPDQDRVRNLDEYREGCDPQAADSDRDGMDDRFEVRYGFRCGRSGDQALDVDGDGRPWLQLHAFARRHPTLAVAGLLQPDSGLFPLVHWQAVAFARWLRLRAAAPTRAAEVWARLTAGRRRRWTRAHVK